MSNIVINIKACKNILEGSFKLQTDTINIKYAQNGTGKSTIGEALQHYVLGDISSTVELQSFLTTEPPLVSVSIENENGTYVESPAFFNHVEIFNEKFVNDIVFKDNQAITDSFNVFIRTTDYNKKKEVLDDKLIDLVKHMNNDEITTAFYSTLSSVLSRFFINNDGTIAKKGLFKDALNPANTYQIPAELSKYKKFFAKDTRVSWITWKSQGYEFVKEEQNCPFCATDIVQEEMQKDEEIFNKSYNKTVVKNQKVLEDFITSLKSYILEDKYSILLGYTRKIEIEEDFRHDYERFIKEINFITTKIQAISSFSTYGIANDEIQKIEEKLNALRINEDIFIYFRSSAALGIYNLINEKLDAALQKAGEIKAGTAALNKLVRDNILESSLDINDFLTLAGINYTFTLDSNSEGTSIAKLIYKGMRTDLAEQANLRRCLSWGERNAVALVLFTYYANSKNADLIILDDPISSFDKSKKFAIVDRLFKKPSEVKSLLKKTVLFLTHDFEPIVDLYIENKFSNKLVTADYVVNKNGSLEEHHIDLSKDVLPITVLYLLDIRNTNLSFVCRFAALRKYLEYVTNDYFDNPAYHYVSSLLKGRLVPISEKNDKASFLNEEQMESASTDIAYITGIPVEEIDYATYLNLYFTKATILETLKLETRNYYKLEILRTLCVLENCEIRIPDEVLRKYLNSSFHIENDYAYYLNYQDFDPLPPFVVEKMESFIKTIV